MNTVFTISEIALLFILAYQDFKDRLISWIPLVLLFVLFSFSSILANNFQTAGRYFGMNVLILFVQLAGLTLYSLIKNKRLVNIIDTQIGLGDVLFFVLLCTVFSPVNFLPFYTGSLIVSVILFFIFKKLSISKTTEVPLAGIMSVMLILLLAVKLIVPTIDLYDDYWVLKYFDHYFLYAQL